MVFIFICFSSSQHLSLSVVNWVLTWLSVRLAVPGGGCALTASAHPPLSFFFLQPYGLAPCSIPSFFLAGRHSPLLLQSGILLWQPVSPFCPNPLFKNSPHPRDLSRMKMVSYRQQVTDWKTTMYFRPLLLMLLSVEFPRSNSAHVSAFFPTFLIIFQFLTNCLSVII